MTASYFLNTLKIKIQQDIDRFFNEAGNDYIQEDENILNLNRNVRATAELVFDRYCNEILKQRQAAASAVPNISEIRDVVTSTTALTENASSSETSHLKGEQVVQTGAKSKRAKCDESMSNDESDDSSKSNKRRKTISKSRESTSNGSSKSCHSAIDSQKTAAVKKCEPRVEVPPVSSTSIGTAPSSETSDSRDEPVVQTKQKRKTRHSTGKLVDKSETNVNSDGPDGLPKQASIPQNSVVSTPKTLHKCSQKDCAFSSPSAKQLNLHMVKHSDDRPFKCELCPMDFKAKANLNRHLNSEACKKRQETEKFMCSTCRKSDIVGRIKFVKHLKIHYENTTLSDDELIAEYRKIV
ncbi:zinc finger protein 708-like [Sitodiplosis mosellana]|uniref:zinc finger protein 708-like n=1 Tax=Sitodiplosis mosellana TaxID=263140 RepID=UPI002444C476|nr:zinc finger protein 708-like [Sitodiplosis mosellana]XP_055296605.1 zinc finger protein 708-like [Sitodiplosis mosellana]